MIALMQQVRKFFEKEKHQNQRVMVPRVMERNISATRAIQKVGARLKLEKDVKTGSMTVASQ